MSLIPWFDEFKSGRIKLVLGSQSVPRKAVLEQLGLPFETRVSKFEENLDKSNPMEYPLATSWGKHREFDTTLNNTVLITCDTVIIADNYILEKPTSKQHAYQMMQSLSGKPHKVVTGVVVSLNKHFIDFSVVTEVTFKLLSKTDIEAYVATGECDGKAGAYAIQGLGQLLVEKISGSYSNVVGLPLSEIADAIRKLLDDNSRNKK